VTFCRTKDRSPRSGWQPVCHFGRSEKSVVEGSDGSRKGDL